ncbi:MAG TPA: hypothetical protein VLS91_06865 [Acidimicrobiales bacterium]|nr:hypothetical protein [Acidimicrobiales bacterium]
MSATRLAWGIGVVFYVVLWAIALNGATSLIAPLVVPVVLAVLVYAGLALNRFLGITPRRQHFSEREDDPPR